MNIIEKLELIKQHYDKVLEKLSQSEVLGNQELLIRYSKEESDLKAYSELYHDYQSLTEDLNTYQQLLTEAKNSNDAVSTNDIKTEITLLLEKKDSLLQKIETMLLPKDPEEDKDVILEIRSAAGGEEAALFSANLFRMYMNYADIKGWKTDLLSSNATGLGGFKEIIVTIKGKNVYYQLMFESGVHRVQRVPDTESSGRVHTSTATVAVMPEIEETEIKIRPEDIKLDTFCASGNGGQNVQKNETAVRVTHLPTGIAVACQDERSQLQNRERAMVILRARIYDIEKRKKEEEEARNRKSQVGMGDRSEKIRTYNYPQNRITDHRIGLTLHNLQEVLNGSKLDEFIEELRKHYDEERRQRFSLQ